MEVVVVLVWMFWGCGGGDRWPAELTPPPREASENLGRSTMVQDGALTYELVGEAVFGEPDHGGTREYSTGGPQPSLREQILGSRRVDSDGLEWIVVDVDDDYLCEVRGVCDDLDAEQADEVEESGLWTPNAWSGPTCTTTYGAVNYFTEHRDWGAYDPVVVTAPTAAQQTVVTIHYTDNNPIDFSTEDVDYICSGTVIDTDDILTSAHCVVSAGVNPLNPLRLRVCTLGNRLTGADCTAVVAVNWPTNNWTGNNTQWDVAVLQTVASLSISVGELPLSSASASSVESSTVYNAAYPLTGEDGSGGCVSNHSEDGLFDPDVSGHQLLYSFGAVIEVASGRLKTRLDGADGYSGSPIWACPSGPGGACGTNDTRSVVGVWSGHFNPVSAPEYNGGPFVPNRRTWIESQL